MKTFTLLFAALAMLIASVTAQSTTTCDSACTSLGLMAINCGYYGTDSTLTALEMSCMCTTSGFSSSYGSCYNCLKSNGETTSADYKQYVAIQDACGKSSGSGAAIRGSTGHILAGLAVTVGLGFCGLTI